MNSMVEKKCRICGCTQNDCRQCIEKTGQPCMWVEDDLCSACLAEAYPDSQKTENKTQTMENETAVSQPEQPASSNPQPVAPSAHGIVITEDHADSGVQWGISFDGHNPERTKWWPVPSKEQAHELHKMIVDLVNVHKVQPAYEHSRFFMQLANNPAGMDITIRIKEKNCKFTVSVLPNAGDNSSIVPLLITGTPAELDKDFFSKLGPVIQESVTTLLNAEAHKNSIQDVVKKDDKKPAAAATSSKKDPQAKKSATKAARLKAKGVEKKPAAVKKAPDKEPKEAEEKPRIEEQQLF